MTAARVTWRGQMAAQRIPMAVSLLRDEAKTAAAAGDVLGAEVSAALADVLEREAARQERAR